MSALPYKSCAAKNNICPACRSDMSDLEGVDQNRFSFTLHESEELPTFCFSCNQYTERTVRISGDQESILEQFFFGDASPERTTNVIIFLPQCEQCADLEEPEPVAVDYDHQTMTFAVHYGFRDRVIVLRRNAERQDDDSELSETCLMSIPPTIRLYLQDDHCFENEARILAIRENKIACDQTCFHPGGGGQSPDQGLIQTSDGDQIEVSSIRVDSDGVLWHVCNSVPASVQVGDKVQLSLNKDRRLALMRYHTVLHVLNTITLRDYNGWITGVQINEDYSRIDFKLENFTSAVAADLEEKVNAVLQQNLALHAHYITEAEFNQRMDLLRTLEAKPPIANGQVRVMEITGFDAQACGGTHVHTTGEVGRFTIFKIDNKGKNNKRFYVRLEQP